MSYFNRRNTIIQAVILGISIGGRNDLKCEHLVKFDGTKIEITGLSLGNFKLGSLGIEPTLIQAAGQSLMMLDASQYSLCQKVKGAPDEETKKKYYTMMMDDLLRAQGIYRAIATLSLNPTSQVLQGTVKELLLSSLTTTGQRAVEIENSEVSSTVERNSSLPSENSLEIGNTSLDQKVSELKQSYPELKKQTPLSTEMTYPLKEQCIKDIDNLTKRFDEATDGGKLIEYITGEFSPYMRSVYRGLRCEGMENTAKNLVRNRSINLDTLIQEFKKFSGLGTRQEEELGIMIKLRIEEILQTCRSSIVS